MKAIYDEGKVNTVYDYADYFYNEDKIIFFSLFQNVNHWMIWFFVWLNEKNQNKITLGTL